MNNKDYDSYEVEYWEGEYSGPNAECEQEYVEYEPTDEEIEEIIRLRNLRGLRYAEEFKLFDD